MRPHEIINQRITQDMESRAQAVLDENPGLLGDNPAPPPVLPVWRHDARVVFASVLRSALFACAARTHRAVYVEPEYVPTMPGFRVQLTGTQLSQLDLDVWAVCLHLYRGLDPGRPVGITVRGLERLVGVTEGGAQGQAIWRSLRRLVASQVSLDWDTGSRYTGALVSGAYMDAGSRRLVIEMSPMLLRLLGQEPTTTVDWELRRQVPRDIGSWLVGFLSTYGRGVHRIGLDQLAELSGSDNNRVFKARVKAAMSELVMQRFLQSWGWTSGGCLEFRRKFQPRKQKP